MVGWSTEFEQVGLGELWITFIETLYVFVRVLSKTKQIKLINIRCAICLKSEWIYTTTCSSVKKGRSRHQNLNGYKTHKYTCSAEVRAMGLLSSRDYVKKLVF